MDINKIRKFDKGHVFKTYQNMHKQFEQVFEEFDSIRLPEKFKKVHPHTFSQGVGINKVLVCGMGGSNIGFDLVRSVFLKYLKVPGFIVHDYKLPSWVDKKTLIIISSYSGNTEEPINCFKEAKRKKFNTFIICSGGELSKVESLKYIYDAKYNYALNPRSAIGYSIAVFIALFKKLKLLDFNFNKIKRDINYFSKGKAQAEKFAKSILNKIPIIIASEHLIGNAHIFQNQLNETAKNFSCYFSIPEICHHQFEGLGFPRELNKNIVYILLNSKLYHKRNQKRYKVMKEVLKKKKINFLEILAKNDDVWRQSMYILGLSSYVSFYLAYFNKIDPQPNPWVDYLKQKMKR